MMTIRRSEERGSARHGWLDSWHTFSFADYYDPEWIGFRSLRVINDDTVGGGAGFGIHPHRDMEIITWVLSGALRHRDSMGNKSVLKAGDFQRITAGRGIEHSEVNNSQVQPVHFLQIWIRPYRHGLEPAYDERSFNWGDSEKALTLVASGNGREDSLLIQQDADLWLVRLREGETATHTLASGRHAWIHVAEGELTVNGETLRAGDGAAVSEEDRLTLSASGPVQALLFDLN